MFATQFFQVFLQQRTHLDDAFSHPFDLLQPLLIKFRCIQDLGSDAGAVDWRIGVERPNENLYLGVDAFFLVCTSAANRESTDTFAI